MTRPLVIGITGGIGSGKTAVTNLFAELGRTIIDTDLISREIVQPGEKALESIVREFGQAILLNDGQLDRAALREKIFADPAAKQTLENILHPAIRQRMRDYIDQASGPYALVAIPLLVENNMQEEVDRVLVIDVPEELQIQRAMQRDGNKRSQIEAILASQASREQRLQAADDVLENTKSLEDLQKAVARLDEKYRDFAQKMRGNPQD